MIEKTKENNKLKKIRLLGAILIVLTLIYSFRYTNNLNPEHLSELNILKIYTMGAISVVTIIFIFYILACKELIKKFVIIVSFLGILFILFVPLLKGIDEGAHFYKINSYLNSSDEIPKDIFDAHKNEQHYGAFDYIGVKTDFSKTIKSDCFRGANLYTWISYLPYMIPAYLTISVMHLNIYSVVMILRLSGLITYLIASVYAIKIMPDKKLFMALFCLMPSMFTGAACISADLCTNVSVILFIALWYKLYKEKKTISKKQICFLTFLGIIMACTKIVYALILLLMLVLDIEVFGNKKRKIQALLFIISVVLIAVVINLSFVGKAMINSYPEMEARKDFIISHPIKYFFIVIFSIIEHWKLAFQFTTNNTIFHNIVFVSEISSFLYLLILVASLFSEGSNVEISKKIKWLVGIISFLIIFIIYTSLYVQCSAVESTGNLYIITGLQARYYIPIAVMIMILIPTKKIIKNKNVLWYGATWINFFILLELIRVVF